MCTTLLSEIGPERQILADFDCSTWNSEGQEAEMSGAEAAHEEPGELLRQFAALLRSSPHNLLSPRGLAELEDRHFPESLAFAASLPANVTLLDVGSGGGLPGVIIAIARPDITVHLLDATKKKVDFLVDASARLGRPLEVHHGRAEDLCGGALREQFDVVTARAVAPLERLVPWCAPYLRPGGRLFAIKGDRWAEELAAAQPILPGTGMKVVSVPEQGEAAGVAPPEAPRVVVFERTKKGGMQPGR